MENDGRHLADYFIVSGLPNSKEDAEPSLLEDAGDVEETDPITDIAVIIASNKEVAPLEFTCIEKTPLGHVADLNHGSLRCPQVFLCYRRGTDKPPLLDIGVLYEDKQRIMQDSSVLERTPYGRIANVNNSSSSKTFLTYRRAQESAPCHSLVVKDICVIITNKGENPPHAFCKIEQNLNKAVIGSDVFICYKKSVHRPPSILYRPQLLMRFPQEDRVGLPFPDQVPLFCLPLAASVEKWKTFCERPKPSFSTFVLTLDTAERAYGASLSFYEPYVPNKLQIEKLGGLTDTDGVYVRKSICLISQWPFFHTFRKFLCFLYKQSTDLTRDRSLEQHIINFLYNIPFPSIERPRLVVSLNEDTYLTLRHLNDTPLPMSGASFLELLRNLGPDNCMVALLLVLVESKILIHSLRPQLVTAVSEALVSAIFPCRWQCPYIPLCPLGLSEIIMAPLPFLVGVDSRYFDLHELPNDVVCIDLDTNAIFMPEDKLMLNPRMLPKRAARKLRSDLGALYEKDQYNYGRSEPSHQKDHFESEFSWLRKERDLDLEIQEAFLRFMVEILRDFRTYLRPVTEAPKYGGAKSLCDVDAFMRSRDRAYQPFYQMLVRTQMFSRLVEERSFLSGNDQSLAFFDECCDRCDSNGEVVEKLLHIESVDDNHTAFIAAPDVQTDSSRLAFNGWHALNFEGFTIPVQDQHNMSDCGSNGHSILDDPLGTPSLSRTTIRRSKYEVRSSIKSARKLIENPSRWGRVLLSTCYSLYFVHLPSYVAKLSDSDQPTAVRVAYQILCDAQTRLNFPVDEVCYRVLLFLCAQLGLPALAVKVLVEMKNNKLLPNAITYGYYNKAVMDSVWPISPGWKKLKNVVAGVAQFKRALHKSAVPSVAASSNSLEGISRMSSTVSLPTSSKQAMHLASVGLLMATPSSKVSSPSHSPANSLPRSKSLCSINSSHKPIREAAVIKFKTLPSTPGLLDQPKEFFAKTVSPSLQRMVQGAYSSAFFQNFQLSRIRRFSAGPIKQPDISELRRPNSSPTARGTSTAGGHSNANVGNGGAGGDVISNIRQFTSRLTGMIGSDVYGKMSTSRSLDQMFNKSPPNETQYTASLNGSACDLSQSGDGLKLRVMMTTCCQCVSCKSLVYDEEIMSGWTADDSNLKTRCSCNTSFVPLLYVSIKDTRPLKKEGGVSAIEVSDFGVPYLSPFVLQKEVENLLEHGVSVFSKTSFVDNHSIIYWNMVWYFSRLRLPSHISSLFTRSNVMRNIVIPSGGISEVTVKTLWDNRKLHDCITPPLYTVYKPGDLYIDENDPHGMKKTGREIIEYVKNKKLHDAVFTLMTQRQSWKFGKRNPSIYREILFILILEFGANIINPDWLDREYQRVYDELSVSHRTLIYQYDKYPSMHAKFARRFFGDLELI